MPTIDQLAPAIAASDTDELPVSQAGVSRKLTRAQLLAGMRPGLAVAAGTLLGRTSDGIGDAESITVGPNLRLAGGNLSANAPFTTAALPTGRAPVATDLLPISQSGKDAALAYGPLMNGLAALAGIDLSRHTAIASGAITARSLADSFADHVAIEAFGAVGDGKSDCTDAFNAAVVAGRPILLGPATYMLRGQFTIAQAAEFTGTRGRTILRRPSGSTQAGGAWISVQGATFTARNITFDANLHRTESWGVLVTATCTQSLFDGCTFANATGASLGHGLTIAPNTGVTDHRLANCEARGNAAHGIWVRSSTGVRVLGCNAHDNGAYGICLDDNDPTFARQVRNALVIGNICWANNRGISVGNFNQANTEPPVWGNANPDAIAVVVTNNLCYGNTAYGLALAGQSLLAAHNVITVAGPNAAGILFNAAASRLADNVVSGPGAFGIDAGGCIDCDIVANQVSAATVGINGGGSQRLRIADNRLDGNAWAITIYNVETDGAGNNFGHGTTGLTIANNHIAFASSGGGGINLLDAPQAVRVLCNSFFGTGAADISQCLWANTDSIMVRGNAWNSETRRIINPMVVGTLNQIQIPDISEDIMITAALGGVQSIVTVHAAATAGTVAYIGVTNGGAGYTRANVSISGAGTGAAAIAYVRDGAVIGMTITNAGTGYGTATTVTITGDGTGAAATARVGLPLPENRRLSVYCNAATRFDRAAANPLLDNWTLGDLTVPAGSVVDWVVASGRWHASTFAPGEFLAPAGDGSLVVRTFASGDLTLRPAGGGALRLGTDSESQGCTFTVGRGSPEGAVAAPPGSDYRNLDGGAGATLWIKRTGTDANGLAAIA